MTRSPLWSLLVATALIHAPLAARAQMITVSNCNGGMSVLLIPGDEDAPGKQGGKDCAKACHAACERRGKGMAKKLG